MKHLFAVVAFIAMTSTVNAFWWSGDDKDKQLNAEVERRIQSDQKLAQQQETTGRWQVTSSILSIGCILCLVIGTAIGSTAKNHAKQRTIAVAKPKKQLAAKATKAADRSIGSFPARSSSKVR